MRVKNVSGLGDLDLVLPSGRIRVEAGEVIEVSDEDGAGLIEQVGVWEVEA